MAAKIEVEKTGNLEFRVRITEAGGVSTHIVSIKDEQYARLTGGTVQPEEVIRRSFEFLLERERKESILGRFDLAVISHYFPEFERDIVRRLS